MPLIVFMGGRRPRAAKKVLFSRERSNIGETDKWGAAAMWRLFVGMEKASIKIVVLMAASVHVF